MGEHSPVYDPLRLMSEFLFLFLDSWDLKIDKPESSSEDVETAPATKDNTPLPSNSERMRHNRNRESNSSEVIEKLKSKVLELQRELQTSKKSG
jgi:predicted molibdopterin-dependent oxidoreductase YjgC